VSFYLECNTAETTHSCLSAQEFCDFDLIIKEGNGKLFGFVSGFVGIETALQGGLDRGTGILKADAVGGVHGSGDDPNNSGKLTVSVQLVTIVKTCMISTQTSRGSFDARPTVHLISQLFLVALPGLGLPQERYAHVAAYLERILVNDFHLHSVRLPVARIVDVSIDVFTVFELEVPDEYDPDCRPLTQLGLWIMNVAVSGVVFVIFALCAASRRPAVSAVLVARHLDAAFVVFCPPLAEEFVTGLLGDLVLGTRLVTEHYERERNREQR
jgi:hypothetical protein